MDIHRGMPLPLLAYFDATDEMQPLQATTAKAQNPDENQNVTFCDGFLLAALLVRRRLTGQMSRKDIAYWHSWKKRHAAYMVDAAVDPTDPIPGYIHALSEVKLALQSFTAVP